VSPRFTVFVCGRSGVEDHEQSKAALSSTTRKLLARRKLRHLTIR